jgi:lipoprotein Spr
MDVWAEAAGMAGGLGEVARIVPLWPAIVTAARGCVGTRFRPQGRVAKVGLDCVGVVLIAARAAGVRALRVPAYTLGGEHDAALAAGLAAAGCRRVAAPQDGDVLVIAPSARQRHLAIVTPAGVVHAHAGLGRVVEGPRDGDWAVLTAWRLPGAR